MWFIFYLNRIAPNGLSYVFFISFQQKRNLTSDSHSVISPLLE
jgi:hypothetical protein